MVQLIFGRDMIIPIKCNEDWELIRHKNQSKINKYKNHEDKKIVDNDYKVGEKVMLKKNQLINIIFLRGHVK